MALQHVSDHFGTKGSSVQVNLQAGGAATLFSDAAGTQPLSNPLTVRPNGVVDFYVVAGTYVLIESGNGTDKRTITVADASGGVIPGSQTGKPFARYTHSFGLIPGVMCTAGQEWPNLFKTRLGLTSIDGDATSGARTVEGSLAMCGNGAHKLSLPYVGLVAIEYAGADYRFSGNPPTQAMLNGVTNALRSMLAFASAGQIDRVVSIWSAGNANAAGSDFYGGSLNYTGTTGATLTFTVDGTKCLGGVCYLMIISEQDATRTLSVSVNGGPSITFDKTAQMAQFNGAAGPAVAYTKAVIKLTGMPTSGTPTVVVTAGAGASNASVEAVLYPSATPPKILVVKDPPLRVSDEATYVVAKPAVDARIDAVCAEFANAIPVDLGAGGWWDPDLHLGSDLNHPNDSGMLAITNRLAQVVKTLVG